MKLFLPAVLLLITGCNSQKSVPVTSKDSSGTTETRSSMPPTKVIIDNNPEQNSDTIIGSKPSAPAPKQETEHATHPVPGCIKNLISKYQQDKIENPPRKIYRYSYKGKTVYYVPAICCDIPSDLLDENCNVIAHPDGGFTGKGDGRAPEFNTLKRDEKLIWEDTRALR